MASAGESLDLAKRDGYAVLTLNRPEVRNALSFSLVSDIATALHDLDSDSDIGATVLAGNEKAFSGGADVAEMAPNTLESFTRNDPFTVWDRLTSVRKPVIAAVEGYALGGGCELAMACDIIVASEKAKFGQPEINLGIMPGAGGTQRLTKAAGKHRSMRYILTGELFSAEDAEKMGLVSAVVPAGKALEEAERMAVAIAAKPRMAVLMAKRAVREAAEGNIMEGIRFERSLFYSLFATLDQKEGMEAFLKKRKPEFKGK